MTQRTKSPQSWGWGWGAPPVPSQQPHGLEEGSPGVTWGRGAGRGVLSKKYVG